MKGTISWWELPVPDLEQAQDFYGRAFGWTFAPFGDTYLMVTDSSGALAGALDLSPERTGAVGLRFYFYVEDLTATVEAIVAAGGTVTTEPELVSDDFGWYAVTRDPFGNWLGLCSNNPVS